MDIRSKPQFSLSAKKILEPVKRVWWELLLAWVELFCALAMLGLEVDFGAGQSWRESLLFCANTGVLAAWALRLLAQVLKKWRVVLMPSMALTLLAVAGAFFLVSIRLAAGLCLMHDGWLCLRWLSGLRRQRSLGDRVLLTLGYHPARSLVRSFLGLIFLGTFLLWLPASSAPSAPPVLVLDALFTAVSATCVTGLITLDTATQWSPFGQGVIFVLFQLGALGMMVISGAMILIFGHSLSTRREDEIRGSFDDPNAQELMGLVETVVGGTLVIELSGALALLPRFLSMPEMSLTEALGFSLFHAVSAFCNAGFSLYSDGLEIFAGDIWVNVVIMALIIVGGLGFGVWMGLWRYMRRGHYLSVHSRLVCVTSLGLVFFGALFFFYFEYHHSLNTLPLGEKLLASVFQSVSTRTAGFNTVPLGELAPVSILVMSLLMFVGASPGSTGGGVKTTTIALVFVTARSFLRSDREICVFGRSLPSSQIFHAFGLLGVATLALGIGLGCLLVTENIAFEKLLFEATSALGTAGLSMGVTSELSGAGRFIVCLLMFMGRVGPLTLVMALSRRTRQSPGIFLPEGKVWVG
jgi:trk system potassium uptake protein